MPNQPALFKDVKDLERVLAATKIVERQFNGPGLQDTPTAAPADSAMPSALVEILDPQPAGFPSSGGYYVGKCLTLSDVDDLTGAPSSYFFDADDLEVLTFRLGGGTLTPGTIYHVTMVQFYDQPGEARMVGFVAAGGGIGDVTAGTCITVTPSGGSREVSVDVECVQANMTFDVTVDVPGCLSIFLTKTRKTLISGESVLDDVDITYAWKTRTITLPTGTGVGGLGACVVPDNCCPTGPAGPPVTTSCCPDNPTPANLTLTVSGGNGSFPVTNDGSGNWDTGEVELTGGGSINLRLYCFGSSVTGWTANVGGGGSLPADYAMNSITYVTRTCDPFSVVYTATLSGTGPLNGFTLTFTVTE